MKPPKKKIIIAAGGTGGHVFPAQALAEQLCTQGWDVHFILESRGSQWKGFDSRLFLHQIFTGNLGTGTFFKKLLNSVFLLVGFFQAILLIYKIRPLVVIGFGGYPSFPVLLASFFYKTKRIVHEQNAILGRVNRWMHPFIDKIATSMPLSKNYSKTIHTGMPVRREIRLFSEKTYTLPQKSFTIVILGGSQGAKVFSEVLPYAFQNITELCQINLNIIQQCRPENLEEARKTYKKFGLKVELTSFIDNISEVLLKSHLVISRAGASSIAEVTTVGRPSLLIPYPWAIDDHQTANARYIQEAGAAWILSEKEFRSDKLPLLLKDLFTNPQKLEKVAHRAHAIGPNDAVDKLIKLIDEQVKGYDCRAC